MLRHLPLVLLLGLIAALIPAAAQNAPKPDSVFNDAPVSQVLLWAQQDLGCGFIYEAELLLRDGKPRRVSADATGLKKSGEKRLFLFEVLRRAGLVCFEVQGLPGPTYQLVEAAEAARLAPLARSREELGERYFATLAIKLERASVQRVAQDLRARLTEGVGSLEIFEPTHTLLVTDFTDRLHVCLDAALQADQPATRDDDLVIADYGPANGDARRYVAALERLRAEGETWKASLHEGSNLIVLSGLRLEVERAGARLKLLDSRPADPAFAETVQTRKLIHIPAEDAARTLRQLFEREVNAGSVQIGGYERSRTLVFRGSKADWNRALELLKALDVDK